LTGIDSKTQGINPILGIIFDLDGTLIKSVVDFPKMKKRMIEYIQNLKLKNLDYTTNQTTNEIILDLNDKMVDENFSENDKKNIFNNISEILTEVEFENIEKVKLLPGVKETIEEFNMLGIKMGILTRASDKYTIATLELTLLKRFFSVVVTRDDFTLLKAKPDLVALNYTINKMNVPPENILFVGDHEIDYNCAKVGGIRFVGVLVGAYNRNILNNLSGIEMVEDFHELGNLIKENNNHNY
jgi:HAD superfamily hydrolase (TIGR01549 family)